MAKTYSIYRAGKEYRVSKQRIIDNKTWNLHSVEYSKRDAESLADLLRKQVSIANPLYARVIRWRPDANVWLVFTRRRPMTAEEKRQKREHRHAPNFAKFLF